MKNLVIGLLVAATVAGAGLIARAEVTGTKNPLMATLVCRNAASDERAFAKTAADVALVCKPLNVKPLMASKAPLASVPGGMKVWQQMYNGIILGKYAL